LSKIVPLIIRAFLFWFINRNDPEMIKFRELKRIRNANKAQKKRIDWALRHGDTSAISLIWRELSNDGGAGRE
jgi:hypothetical protein